MNKPLTWRSPKTEIKASPIHGKGIFATAPFRKNEVVAVKGGYILTHEEWQAIERDFGSVEIQVTEDLFMAPTNQDERDGCLIYTNHSCEPNIAVQGQIVFVAMRDIAAGEELTHDWATTDDGDFKMLCNCGAPSCRGTITGKDWMKPELRKKYEGWFCWFLQRRIDSGA